MKICLISNLYEPYARGGAERIVKLTAEELAKNHEVCLISTKPFTKLSDLKAGVEMKGSLKIHRFFPLNIFYYLNDYKHSMPIRFFWHFFDVFNWHSAILTRQIVKRENPDLIIIHNLKGLGFLIPRALKSLNKKIVQVLHDAQYAIPSGLIIKGQEKDFLTDGFLTKMYQAICRWLLKPINTVISPSKWLLEFYNKKGYFVNSKKSVMRNPIVNVSSEINSRGESKDLGKIAFIGQIEKHKGVEFLLESVKDLPQVKLTVVGDGTMLKSLKERFSNVNFLGKLNHEQMRDVFAKNAYVVVPSLCYENSPTVIYESFSCGRPVIVADIGGAAELVKGENTGFVFEAGNKADLIEKIKLAINNENYNEMSANCLEKVENLTVDKYCEQLIKL
jgi:glycosyltransferase involved in cell wall biosynthesis